MKTTITTFCSLAAVLSLGLVASPARADHVHVHRLYQVEELAAHVMEHSRDLYHEARHELLGHPDQRHVTQDISEVYRTAASIYNTARSCQHIDELCRDARRLDKLVHHLEDTLDHVRSHDIHHHGHYHGPDLRTARKLVRMVEQDTHELMEEIERIERRYGISHAAPVAVARPGVSVGPSGVYFGGRSFGIRIGR
jgi:uncharacterized protein (UPF0335 family)